jgi:hypothetical protein
MGHKVTVQVTSVGESQGGRIEGGERNGQNGGRRASIYRIAKRRAAKNSPNL